MPTEPLTHCMNLFILFESFGEILQGINSRQWTHKTNYLKIPVNFCGFYLIKMNCLAAIKKILEIIKASLIWTLGPLWEWAYDERIQCLTVWILSTLRCSAAEIELENHLQKRGNGSPLAKKLSIVLRSDIKVVYYKANWSRKIKPCEWVGKGNYTPSLS